MGHDQESSDQPDRFGERFARTTVPPQLDDPERRASWRLPRDEDARGPYIIELNLQHTGGLPGAIAKLVDGLHDEVAAGGDLPPPERIAKTYFRWQLSVKEWRRLVAADERSAPRERAIYRLWPDFPVSAQASLATVKADAAYRAFAAGGDGIVWAVVDSGIDAAHCHFGAADAKQHTLLAPEVAELHRCFVAVHDQVDGIWVRRADQPQDADWDATLTQEERARRIAVHREAALCDPFGHGTHVAGIIAGGIHDGCDLDVIAYDREFKVDESGQKLSKTFAAAAVPEPWRLRGVAPACRLVSLRVLDHRGDGRTSDVIRALEYIREMINDDPKLLRVHGVNLSVGYEFDAEMFACGQSPLCAEVNRLVQAGVVVVAAAGNTGYGTVASSTRAARAGLTNTINDPGNAELAVTVGSTHRDAPHTYGVSYFSSKGPTGDGRPKPDLVAPGERIISCAAGAKLAEAMAQTATPSERRAAYYVDDSGTSMAAPHVSGAVAAFLSIRREFIGKPLEVKRIFLETATPLGRERYFEGHGLLDLMRAIQSV